MWNCVHPPELNSLWSPAPLTQRFGNCIPLVKLDFPIIVSLKDFCNLSLFHRENREREYIVTKIAKRKRTIRNEQHTGSKSNNRSWPQLGHPIFVTHLYANTFLLCKATTMIAIRTKTIKFVRHAQHLIDKIELKAHKLLKKPENSTLWFTTVI